MSIPHRKEQARLANDANSLYSLGLLALAAKRYMEAVSLLRQAVAEKPNDPVRYNNLALALHASGLPQEAVRIMRIAIAINPGFAAARENLSVILSLPGEDQNKQPLSMRHTIAAEQNAKGLALAKEGKLEDACTVYLNGIDINPSDFALLTNLGSALTQLGRHDEAIPCFVHALCLTSSAPEIYFQLSSALRAKGCLSEAIRACEAGLSIDERSSAYVNLGILWREAGNLDLATAAFHKCLALNPNESSAHIGLASLLLSKGQSDQAINVLEKARTIAPDSALIHYNLSTILLMRGDYVRGWALFESRCDSTVEKMIGNTPKRLFTTPKWCGEDVSGKSLFIHWEQGHGDTIQFIRYIPVLAARGARIYLNCQHSLERLLSNLPGIVVIVRDGSAAPKVDFHCPLMSLPGKFGTTLDSIPANIPYISVSQEEVPFGIEKLDELKACVLGWYGPETPMVVFNTAFAIDIEI